MTELAMGVSGGGTGTGTNNIVNVGSIQTNQLNVDNLRLDGNTLSSQDTNGPILLAPNGNGRVNAQTTPGVSVGGFPSGGLQVTNPSTSANANSVITGHNLNNTNKQLWYFGSLSGSNDDIGIINRQNASLTFLTNNLTRMKVDAAGRIGVGATTLNSQLHVDQASATGAIPVLILDQGDDSEEMIEFIGTIGVGNALEAVGAKTLTTTHFVKISLPGALTRYFPVGTIA